MMGFISKENKQRIYIYSSDSKLGRRGLEIVEALDASIRAVNINKDNLSSIVWLEIVSMLQCKFNDIFNVEENLIEENNPIKNFVVSDWLQFVNQNPSILTKPIAINGSEGIKILNKKDIFEFFSKIEAEETENTVNYYNHSNQGAYVRAI